MTNFDFDHPEILDAVRRALAEDIGTGDLTTNSTVAAGRRATGRSTGGRTEVPRGRGGRAPAHRPDERQPRAGRRRTFHPCNDGFQT